MWCHVILAAHFALDLNEPFFLSSSLEKLDKVFVVVARSAFQKNCSQFAKSLSRFFQPASIHPFVSSPAKVKAPKAPKLFKIRPTNSHETFQDTQKQFIACSDSLNLLNVSNNLLIQKIVKATHQLCEWNRLWSGVRQTKDLCTKMDDMLKLWGPG